jgi:N-formylglutamate amidohydrolase
MDTERVFALDDIKRRLEEQRLPFVGITPLGSAEFAFERPAFFAACAIHAGHRIRPDLRPKLAVDEASRLREEDPHTESFTHAFPIRVIARYSRFEFDINRNRETAIYQRPDMAWGLEVLKMPLSDTDMEAAWAKWQEFHDLMDVVVDFLLTHHPFGVLFDFHSYNYQRDQRVPWYEDDKPVINLGTGPVNTARFRPILDDLVKRFQNISLEERPISVGENVVFKGGYLSRRLSRQHYDRLCVLAIEFKKVFMDEWRGELDRPVFEALVGQINQVVDQFIPVAEAFDPSA